MPECVLKCNSGLDDEIRATRECGDEIGLRAFTASGTLLSVFANPANARTFARGILTLADEIDGGERVEVTPVKVGDRIRVLRDMADGATVNRGDEFVVRAVAGDTIKVDGPRVGWSWHLSRENVEIVDEPATSDTIKVGDRVVVVREYSHESSPVDGKYGEVRRIDARDEAFPFKVLVDGDTSLLWVHEVRKIDAPTPSRAIKVGDEVVIVSSSSYPETVGRRGTVGRIDPYDEDLPFRIVDAYGDYIGWVSEVRKVDVPADEPAVDVAPERAALVERAKELLTGVPHGAEDIVRMAEFLAKQ